jgi:hypothetical protein
MMAPPRIAIETDTQTEAQRIEASLQDFGVVRDGLRLTLTAPDGRGTILGSLLNALEDCLTHNRLRPVRIEVDERRYVLYARREAPPDERPESSAA